MPIDGADTLKAREGLLFDLDAAAEGVVFSLNEDQLDAIVAAFSAPVPVILRDAPAGVAAEQGRVESIRRDGRQLYGTVAAPGWLGDLLDAGSCGVQPDFDATAGFSRLNVVRGENLTPAALFAASGTTTPVTPGGEVHPGACFDLEHRDDSDTSLVRYRDSLLFRTGDYPLGKGKDGKPWTFTLTPEEAARTVASFTGPVPNVIDHVGTRHGISTILDGKLGHVEEMRLSDDGREIRGTVAIPKWLDSLWDAPTKQVSCEFRPDTKEIFNLGLVVKGRIPGAALFAAFAVEHPEDAPALTATFGADKTWQGQSLLQSIHDTAASAGATCRQPDDAAVFHSAAELAQVQAVHDAACEGGAICRFLSEPKAGEPGNYSYRPMFSSPPAPGPISRFAALFTGRKRHDGRSQAMQQVHTLVAGFGGICPAKPAGPGLDDDDIAAPIFALFGDTTKQHKAMVAIHDMTVEHGATCPGATATNSGTGNPPGATFGVTTTPPTFPPAPRLKMSKWDKLREASASLSDTPTDDELDALFSHAPADVLAKHADAAKAQVEAATFSALDPAVKARLDKLEADNASLTAKNETERVAKAKGDAALFAMGVWKAKGLTVPARETLEAALFAAGELEHAGTPAAVTFSAAGATEKVTGGLVDALKAFAAEIPKDPMVSQIIDDSGKLEPQYTAVFSHKGADDPNRPMTQDERDAMLAKTEIGRAILAKRAATSNGRA